MITADVAIVGGGIAGASLGAELAGHRPTVLIEAELHPGMHATGRSAAFWSESYGGPMVQPLTTASGDFLRTPPRDFSRRGFLSARGAIHLARTQAARAFDEFEDVFRGSRVELTRMPQAALREAIPGLVDDWVYGLAEPACSDIDVAALHAAYLAAFRRRGGRMVTDARVTRIEAVAGGMRLTAGEETITCRVLVNAAGAWADDLAVMAGAGPLGVRPYRRTLVQLRVDPPAPAGLPLVIDVEGGFYFKGEAGGRVWLSPHDETLCEACDAAAEELDVATAIDRLAQVVDWRIERVERSWAGLRSFAPDRLPVYGWDPRVEGFFWCAGQGGFGIQTAPAAAKMAAALLLGNKPDEMVAHVDPKAYDPARFGEGGLAGFDAAPRGKPTFKHHR